MAGVCVRSGWPVLAREQDLLIPSAVISIPHSRPNSSACSSKPRRRHCSLAHSRGELPPPLAAGAPHHITGRRLNPESAFLAFTRRRDKQYVFAAHAAVERVCSARLRGYANRY